MLDPLQTARSQWRNMKTLESLAGKAPLGEVNPALVMARALANDPQTAYTSAALGDLTRIGQQFLKVPPNSGTAERMQSLNLLAGAAKAGLGLAAGGGAYYLGGPALAAGGAAGARIIGDGLRNQAYVNRLVQRGVNPLPEIGTGAGNVLSNVLVPGASLASHPKDQ